MTLKAFSRLLLFIAFIGLLVALIASLRCCISPNYATKPINSVKESFIRKEVFLKQDTVNVIDSLRNELIDIKRKYNNLVKKPSKYFYHDTLRIDSIVFLVSVQEKIINADSSLLSLKDDQIRSLYDLDSMTQADKKYLIYKYDSLYNSPKGNAKSFIKGFGVGLGAGLLIGGIF